MNKIYSIISELTNDYRKMCYGITKNKETIDDAVQELMLYFMQMNQQTLKSIYDKDGKKGLLKYGAVVLKRALTSKRSPFYYKYKKYYTNLYGINMTHTSLDNFSKSIYNLPQNEETGQWKKLEKIDKILEDVYWYDKKVFELYYYETNTLDSLSKKTGISRNSIFNTIVRVRQHIKEIIDELTEDDLEEITTTAATP